MANYISANVLTPPTCRDTNWAGKTPQQNYSQHVRLLPYMEQTTAYNAFNLVLGARWNSYSTPFYDVIQKTVLVMQISSFLCPSDGAPGASSTESVGGISKVVGTTNYPVNLGLNRRINAAPPGTAAGNWAMNGPTYNTSDWDGAARRTVSINDFLDGTSNTVIYGEWVKGPAALPGKNGLGMVYQSNLAMAAYPTDYQFAQAVAALTPTTANQSWGWKGEWWAFGGTLAYSHTNLPNRTAWDYNGGNNEDGRSMSTLINASSNHPGGVNALFMDGSVRFIKSSVNAQAWYAIATPDNNEVVSSDAY